MEQRGQYPRPNPRVILGVRGGTAGNDRSARIRATQAGGKYTIHPWHSWLSHAGLCGGCSMCRTTMKMMRAIRGVRREIWNPQASQDNRLTNGLFEFTNEALGDFPFATPLRNAE
jgi:hypothetical protein